LRNPETYEGNVVIHAATAEGSQELGARMMSTRKLDIAKPTIQGWTQ